MSYFFTYAISMIITICYCELYVFPRKIEKRDEIWLEKTNSEIRFHEENGYKMILLPSGNMVYHP